MLLAAVVSEVSVKAGLTAPVSFCLIDTVPLSCDEWILFSSQILSCNVFCEDLNLIKKEENLSD